MPSTYLSHFDGKKRKLTGDQFRPTDDNDVPIISQGGQLVENVEEHVRFESGEDSDRGSVDDVEETAEWDDLWQNDEDEEGEIGVNSFSELFNTIRGLKDEEIQFLMSTCLGRLSQNDFERFLTSQNFEFAERVRHAWKLKNAQFSVHFGCNRCGRSVARGSSCCGPIAKFVRRGIQSQLEELVEHYYDSILETRRQLRAGSANHNLESPYFSHLWKMEKDNCLNLSGILSVDGVSVPGNKKKIWPISIVLLDLKTSEMQQSDNVMLEGIIECSTNPSTVLWNSFYPLISSDCNNLTIRARNKTANFRVVSLAADQPAKRSLLGFRSHQSAYSCFYCLSPGTFYKGKGSARSQRIEETLEDSRHGRNGFGPVPSKFLELFMPFETPIDILHDCGEGIFQLILKEVWNKEEHTGRKSNLFIVASDDLRAELDRVVLPSPYSEIENCRNGTNKINFFRLSVCCVAMESDIFETKARLIIIALSLLVNKLYSGGGCDKDFDNILCEAAAFFLKDASDRYLSCKVHEFIYHLPYANKLFQNVAPLSTFAFESSYQFALLGYSPKITRNYCETVCSRRELNLRSKKPVSDSLRAFLSLTPGLVASRTHCKTIIKDMKPVDIISAYTGNFYSQLILSFGTLRSEYFDAKTTDDVFFAGERDELSCYRFVAAVDNGGVIEVLAEPLVQAHSDYVSLKQTVKNLDSEELYHALRIIDALESYKGALCAVFSGERVILPVSSIYSTACYTHTDHYLFILSVNGVPIHN